MQSDADVVGGGGGVMTAAPPKRRPPSGSDHEAHSWMTREALALGERLGSGDGEREASMTRQMPFEPLPASVLFALGITGDVRHGFFACGVFGSGSLSAKG